MKSSPKMAGHWHIASLSVWPLEEGFARLTQAGQRIDDLPAILTRSLKTARALSCRFDEYLKELMPDRSDRNCPEARLRKLRVSASYPAPGGKYPADIEQILEKIRCEEG